MKRVPRLDAAAARGAFDGVMGGFAKVVTDRRWAAPLAAMALGFGLFLGVAIGPATSGSLAGGGPILAVTAPADERPEPPPEAVEEEPFEEPVEVEPGFEEESFGGEELAAESPLPGAESGSEAPPSREPPAEEEEPSEAISLKGTVVRVNPLAASYTLAAPGGELVSVHAAKLPQPGAKLSVEATPLPNNTFAEESREKSGTATQAAISGMVTHVDPAPAAPGYTVSGRGSSLRVHVDPVATPARPALGAYAKVTVAIEKAPAVPPVPEPPPAVEPPPVVEPPDAGACLPDSTLKPAVAPPFRLVQRKLVLEPGEPSTYLDLAGVLTAVCPASGQALLSADDLREGGDDLLLAVPVSLSTAKLKPGQPLLATAEVGEDGTLTLAGLASDAARKGAEDTRSAQGDLAR